MIVVESGVSKVYSLTLAEFTWVLKDNFSVFKTCFNERIKNKKKTTTKTNIKENNKVFFFENHCKNGVHSNLTYGQPDSSKLTTS